MNENGIKTLAEENLGLVHLCANRFRGKGIEYDDLYGAGCIGLLKAARAFDETRGLRFSTYAVPVILGEIKRLFRDGGTIKVSRSIKELSLRLNIVREKFCQEHDREPTVQELSELTGLDEEAILEAINTAAPPLSLTESTEENGGQLDIPVEAPDTEITDHLSLQQVLLSLETRDRKIIYLRYFKNQTQTQVAQALEMTQVQVSRREKKILAQMKTELFDTNST